VKPAVQPSHYDEDWNRFKKHFNATTLEDMRKVPATELAQAAFDLGVDFGPILDAAVAEDPVAQYKADGAYITLEALLIGDTTDEGTLWSRFGESNQIYQKEEKKIPAELLDRFHALYPPQALESKATAIPMLDQLLGERKFQCPIERTVKAILDVHPSTELYRYRFDRHAEYTRPYGIEKHHGVDLLYVFLNDALTPPELEVAKQMVDQWVAFAYGLDLESEAGWKQYDKTSKTCMVYGEAGNEFRSIEDTQDAEHYKFWEDVEECQSK
jgi:carboxylesterase type B